MLDALGFVLPKATEGKTKCQTGNLKLMPDLSPVVLRLEIRGLGPVPSFKNNKMLARGKLITDPKKQKWMDQVTRSLESQLLSAIRMSVAGMETALPLPFWTALSEQFDDSVQWIPEIYVKAERCEKGDEGATICIELI